jgi:hypothetical protein
MKKIILFSAILIFTGTMSDVTGQDLTKFMNKRKNTAEKATEERVGREADKVVTKEVNKALDKIFGKEETPAKTPVDSVAPASSSTPSSSSRSGSSSVGTGIMMRAMGLSAGTANVKPVYEFDGFIEMTVTYDKQNKEEEKTTYTTYIDSKSLDYGVLFDEPENSSTSVIIFDTQNALMLTLADQNGERTGFAIGFTPEQTEAISSEYGEEKEEETVDPYKTYKTGKTKNILGYRCEEYLIEDDNSRVTMWITDDLDKEMKKTYMQNATFAGMFAHAYYTNGTVMEYVTEYKKSGEKTVMQVTDIDLNKRNIISTQGYTIMNMGAMMENEAEKDE